MTAADDPILREWFFTTWFWIAQDWRNAYFRRACPECRDDDGVPLARIILANATPDGASLCRVLAIDPYPPHRRPMHLDRAPAGKQQVNLAEHVWELHATAASTLTAKGLRIARVGELKAGQEGVLAIPPLADVGSPPDGAWVAIFTKADPCTLSRVATVVPWVNPELLKLTGTGIAAIDAVAGDLAQGDIADVFDLATVDLDVIASVPTLSGQPVQNAEQLRTLARDYVARLTATLSSTHPWFKPLG